MHEALNKHIFYQTNYLQSVASLILRCYLFNFTEVHVAVNNVMENLFYRRKRPIISLRHNKNVKIIRKVNSLASIAECMWYIYLFHAHNWPYQLLCAGPWVCCLEIEWMLKCCLPMFLCSKCSLKQSFDNHFNPGGIYYGAKCSAQTSGQLFITFKWWHFSKYHSSCIINNVSIAIWKIHGESLSLESLFERERLNVPHFPFQS